MNTTSAVQAPVVPSPADPIAKPAAAHMNRTLGLMTASTTAVTNARPGPIVVIDVNHPGVCAERLRVNHR